MGQGLGPGGGGGVIVSSSGGSSIVVGTTAIVGGTSGNLLYDNSHFVGEESLASLLASPPAIGGTTAAAGSFTTLSASSTVSGSGFSTYLASPPAIGGTAPAAGSFTTLDANGANTSSFTAGQLNLGGSATNGGTVGGKGSTYDVSLVNDAGTVTLGVNTGANGIVLPNQTSTFYVASTGTVNTNDIINFNHTTAAITSMTLSNASVNSAGGVALYFANGSSGATTEGSIVLNGSANTSGNGDNSLTINGKAGLWLQGGSTNAIVLTSAGVLKLPAVASDTGQSDATLCDVTSSGTIYYGSGTGGICLTTSSERFKHDIHAAFYGFFGGLRMLWKIFRLDTVQFAYDPGHGFDPKRVYWGWTAEQMSGVFPELVGHDAEGRPNSIDMMGVLPRAVAALQAAEYLLFGLVVTCLGLVLWCAGLHREAAHTRKRLSVVERAIIDGQLMKGRRR